MNPLEPSGEFFRTSWQNSLGSSAGCSSATTPAPENDCEAGQDADVYRIRLRPGETVAHELMPGRCAWLQIAEGALDCNGVALETGDGASTEAPGQLTLTATQPTEALLFDLA
jgi:quercetin 2,3-dioxygenase